MLHCAIRLKKGQQKGLKTTAQLSASTGRKTSRHHINKDIDVIVYMRLQLNCKKGK